MASLYLALLSVTVTLHASCTYPTSRNPKAYGLNTCTGVFISPDEVLTAGHCVAHSRGKQWIKTSDNKSFSVKIIKLDKFKDLALLRVTNQINHLYTSLGNPILKSQSVYTVNSGGDYEGTFNSGMVNNIVSEEGVLTIMHNAAILPGASGSGLFNDKKQLIGLNVATIKGFSEAVDSLEIKIFLGRE